MRIQILADIYPRPTNPSHDLHKTLPSVGPSLAFTIEPLEQNPRGKMAKGRAFIQIIRCGVIIEMPFNPGFCPTQHLSFPQNRPALACPFGKFPEALCKFLATGAALYLAVPRPALSAIMRKSQKGKLLWLFAAFLRICTRKSPKFNAAGLLFGHLQAKTLQPVF